METRSLRSFTSTVTLAALAVACSSSSSAGGVGLGGSSSLGGATNGGADAAGSANGGAMSAGSGGRASGSSSLGGASAGSSFGGALALGGASAGGAVPTAGTTTGGGATATGGNAARGGNVSGGAGEGGASATGSGGKTSTGTPSKGCSVASPMTGTSIDGTMTVGGQERTYRLSVPADYAAGEALPVVFVFNGVGGTGPQAQQAFKLETGHRAIFIYPTPLPNSQTPGQIAWDFNLNGVDVPYFDALVTYLSENYCVDTNRIFALGASSGAIMSNMLGCFRGDVLRAIAPSSGMDWQQSGCKGDVAVMVICGAQDTFNPCDDAKNGGASQINVWAPANACTMQTAASSISDICVSYQGCKPADPLLLCTHSGGHGWPTSNGDFWWQFFMSLN